MRHSQVNFFERNYMIDIVMFTLKGHCKQCKDCQTDVQERSLWISVDWFQVQCDGTN